MLAYRALVPVRGCVLPSCAARSPARCIPTCVPLSVASHTGALPPVPPASRPFASSSARSGVPICVDTSDIDSDLDLLPSVNAEFDASTPSALRRAIAAEEQHQTRLAALEEMQAQQKEVDERRTGKMSVRHEAWRAANVGSGSDTESVKNREIHIFDKSGHKKMQKKRRTEIGHRVGWDTDVVDSDWNKMRDPMRFHYTSDEVVDPVPVAEKDVDHNLDDVDEDMDLRLSSGDDAGLDNELTQRQKAEAAKFGLNPKGFQSNNAFDMPAVDEYGSDGVSRAKLQQGKDPVPMPRRPPRDKDYSWVFELSPRDYPQLTKLRQHAIEKYANSPDFKEEHFETYFGEDMTQVADDRSLGRYFSQFARLAMRDNTAAKATVGMRHRALRSWKVPEDWDEEHVYSSDDPRRNEQHPDHAAESRAIRKRLAALAPEKNSDVDHYSASAVSDYFENPDLSDTSIYRSKRLQRKLEKGVDMLDGRVAREDREAVLTAMSGSDSQELLSDAPMGTLTTTNKEQLLRGQRRRGTVSPPRKAAVVKIQNETRPKKLMTALELLEQVKATELWKKNRRETWYESGDTEPEEALHPRLKVYNPIRPDTSSFFDPPKQLDPQLTDLRHPTSELKVPFPDVNDFWYKMMFSPRRPAEEYLEKRAEYIALGEGPTSPVEKLEWVQKDPMLNPLGFSANQMWEWMSLPEVPKYLMNPDTSVHMRQDFASVSVPNRDFLFYVPMERTFAIGRHTRDDIGRFCIISDHCWTSLDYSIVGKTLVDWSFQTEKGAYLMVREVGWFLVQRMKEAHRQFMAKARNDWEMYNRVPSWQKELVDETNFIDEEYVEHIDSPYQRERRVIALRGHLGFGVSTQAYYAAAYAIEQGWFVYYMDAERLAFDRGATLRESPDQGNYDQPRLALHLFLEMLENKSHIDSLSKMYVRLPKTLELFHYELCPAADRTLNHPDLFREREVNSKEYEERLEKVEEQMQRGSLRSKRDDDGDKEPNPEDNYSDGIDPSDAVNRTTHELNETYAGDLIRDAMKGTDQEKSDLLQHLTMARDLGDKLFGLKMLSQQRDNMFRGFPHDKQAVSLHDVAVKACLSLDPKLLGEAFFLFMEELKINTDLPVLIVNDGFNRWDKPSSHVQPNRPRHNLPCSRLRMVQQFAHFMHTPPAVGYSINVVDAMASKVALREHLERMDLVYNVGGMSPVQVKTYLEHQYSTGSRLQTPPDFGFHAHMLCITGGSPKQLQKWCWFY